MKSKGKAIKTVALPYRIHTKVIIFVALALALTATLAPVHSAESDTHNLPTLTATYASAVLSFAP